LAHSRAIVKHFDLQEIVCGNIGEKEVIKCHLSTQMGRSKLKITDLARETGINRGTITRLYHETASRVDIEVIDSLCQYFECGVGDLFEFIEK